VNCLESADYCQIRNMLIVLTKVSFMLCDIPVSLLYACLKKSKVHVFVGKDFILFLLCLTNFLLFFFTYFCFKIYCQDTDMFSRPSVGLSHLIELTSLYVLCA